MQVILVGCWVYVRCKFMEVKKGVGSKGSGKVDWVLNYIQKFYCVEMQLKEENVVICYI